MPALISHRHSIKNNIWTNIGLSELQKPAKKVQKPSESLTKKKPLLKMLGNFVAFCLPLPYSPLEHCGLVRKTLLNSQFHRLDKRRTYLLIKY